jgi:hypothetical protein
VVVVTVVAVDTAAADAIVAINVVTYSIAPGYFKAKRIRKSRPVIQGGSFLFDSFVQKGWRRLHF